MDFFSDYPRFFLTSEIGTEPERLNRCHDVLIQRNIDLIRGRRILDIGSHDGRWTFAALKGGAAHVTGIELRPQLISNAEQSLVTYGIPKGRYAFICGYFFDVANKLDESFETVFCFGFFYHTLRHAELLSHIKRLDARAFIIDTAIVPAPASEQLFRLFREAAAHQGNGSAICGAAREEAIVGIPSLGAVTMLLDYFGYTSEVIDWWNYLSVSRDIADLADYAAGKRATIVGRVQD
jgi:SAM-dependent methyltransferase